MSDVQSLGSTEASTAVQDHADPIQLELFDAASLTQENGHISQEDV